MPIPDLVKTKARALMLMGLQMLMHFPKGQVSSNVKVLIYFYLIGNV